jgi:peptide/nickel transport system substrate-binding protein
VSGGPFELTQYKKDDIALFAKNPNFYGPKPLIDGFGIQYFTNDDARIQALKHNSIDAIIGPVPPTSVVALQSAGLHVYIGPALEERDFIINSHKPIHPELLNPDLRKAFEYGIDRNKIVQTAWLGYASPGSTIVPPGTGPWHDSSIQPLPFDLNAANQLLDQAGFPKGSDGIRTANGHPMDYQVIFPDDEKGPGDRAFQIIQTDFLQMGVKLEQRTLDNSAAFDAICGKNCTSYDTFDLAMWDWVPLEDPDFILSVLTCGQFGGWSDTGYCNKSYDQMYSDQGVATSEQARLGIIKQMQQVAFNDRPYVIISYDKTLDAWNSKKWAGIVESNQGLISPLSKQSMEQVHQI